MFRQHQKREKPSEYAISYYNGCFVGATAGVLLIAGRREWIAVG